MKLLVLWSSIIVIACFIALPCSGQNTIEGRVVDANTGEGLPFVHILINGGPEGLVSDLEGYFSLDKEVVNHLQFSYVGYESFQMRVDASIGDELIVKIQPTSIGLDEVVVYAGENPAHRLIRGVYENRELHNPENRTSFRYLAYNKLHASVDIDTTEALNGTEIPDTSLERMVRFFQSQHLFLMESVVERNFKRPNRNREEILASRTSGFKNPLFVLIGTELQSFSFYENEFVLAGVAYKSPVSRNFSKYYEFHMRDTILGSQITDTTYVVAYYPKKGTNFPGLKGLLYIQVPDFAIQNVIAGPALENESIKVTIRQQYEKIDNKYWFPVQLNTDFEMHMVEINGLNPHLKVRTYLDSILIDPIDREFKLGPVDVMMHPNAIERDSSYWTSYRKNPLDAKELKTYHIIDSLGDAHQFERRFEWLQSFFTGRLSMGFIDLELNRILKFNEYEKIRLGGGIRTNNKFSKVVDLGVWFGYGFGDKETKYGGDIGLMLNRDYQVKWRVGFEKELIETGGHQNPLQSMGGLLNNNIRPIFISQFDLAETFFSSLDFFPRANFQSRITFETQERLTLGDYAYLPAGENEGKNLFTFSAIGIHWSYAPGDRYYQGLKDRQRLSYTYPRFYLSYNRGISDFFESEIDYHRVFATVLLEKRFPAFGRLTAEISGGYVTSEVPAALLYNAKYNSLDESNFFKRIILSDRYSFETMRPSEFLSTLFASLGLRYDLSSLLFSPDSRRAPHLEIVARGLVGSFSGDRQAHSGIDFKAPEKGYFESGLEVNRILNSFGIGAYYRIGHYANPDFEDNLALRLTSKFVF